MQDANILTVMQCPRCGAPVEMKSDAVQCPYCGTKLERPRLQVQERVVERVVVHPAPPSAPPRVRGSVLGSLLSIIVVTAIAAGVVYFYGFRGNAISSVAEIALARPPYINKEPVLLQRNDDDAPDMIVRASDQSASKTYITAVDTTKRVVRWKGPVLSKDAAYQAPILTAKGMVYVVDQSTLMALDGDTGAIKWQVSLANALPSVCRDTCLRIFGDTIVALTKDGTLQSFDMLTGKPAWSQRLNSTPSGIQDAAGRVVVVDKTQQGGGDNIVLLIDAVTGTIQKQTPACTIEGTKLAITVPEAVAVTNDGKGLIIMYTWSSVCIQRWDIAANKPSWSTIASMDLLTLFFPTRETRLLTAQTMFLTGDIGKSGWAASVDLQTGKLQRFAEDKRYRLTLIDVVPGVLMVSAVPDYDNETTEIWGLDASTGARKWQYVLKTKGILSAWVAHVTENGLAVMQCVKDEKACAFDMLDPQTGVSGGQTPIARTLSFGNIDGVAWTGKVGLFTISGQVHAIDLANRTHLYSWP